MVHVESMTTPPSIMDLTFLNCRTEWQCLSNRVDTLTVSSDRIIVIHITAYARDRKNLLGYV